LDRVAARAGQAPATARPAGVTHKVKFGETLSTLAYQYYGDRGQWKKIYNANKSVIGPQPDRLRDGVTLVIPSRNDR
jgi:nucleoid-associated protein YgaU